MIQSLPHQPHSLHPSRGLRVHRHAHAWRLAAAVLLLATSYGVGFVRTAPAREALVAAPTRSGVFRDGTYSGWGSSPHGRIQSTVVIRRGRIVSAVITSCRTRYPCSMIAGLPEQIVARQDSDVDIVSGATHSSQAFTRSVAQALQRASRGSAP